MKGYEYHPKNKNRIYTEYLEGGSWRCVLSLTGAHHWIISSSDKTETCRHCKETRPVAIGWREITGNPGFSNTGSKE